MKSSMAMRSSSLVFNVERSEPIVVAPSKPTPYEFKTLSDLDDQKGLRKQSYAIIICRRNPDMEGRDPVKVIKQAVADTLVYYYPFAGRLREGANGRLMVECTAEGILFIEATAQVTSDQFARVILPPVPGAKDLLYDVPGSAGILDCPLMLIQVTRLMCGGFTFGFRTNHTMCDGMGAFQFLKTVAEIARGATAPSICPVWKRELLIARDPPQVSCVHHAYQEIGKIKSMPQGQDEMVQCSFFFGQQEISTLKNDLQCSNFDVLTAFLWRCRTMALNFDPEEVVGLSFLVNARRKFNPPLPVGYYGNAYGKPVAVTTAGEVCSNTLAWAVELVRKTKASVTEEFVRSTMDFLVENGRPGYSKGEIYLVADVSSMPFHKIDFGWGEAVYGGLLSYIPPSTSFVSSKNSEGEEGIVAMVGLPGPAMKRFILEIEKMVKVPNNIDDSILTTP